jgi:long-chain acyl-CoA synthetase
MREKDLGVWKAITWNDFGFAARRIAAALIAEGFQHGDVAAILSETNKEWVFADMSILLASGVVNRVYPPFPIAGRTT